MAKAISFFAGAGGLDMGLEESGFNIELSVEIEDIYCETLRKNHPNANIKKADIMDYNKELVYKDAKLNNNDEIDLIVGGSPCQSWSTAGKRQAFNDSRGKAMLKFANLINEIQPKFFMLENVRGLLSAALKHRPLDERGDDNPPLQPDEQRGSALEYLLNKFKDYKVEVQLLNAANYGVAQKRERVFIIGSRKDLNINYTFPEATHDEKGINGKNKWIALREVLDNLSVPKHHYVKYSPERLEWMRLIPKGGGNWRDLISYGEEVVKKAMGGAYESGGGKVGFYRRVSIDKPSPTLLTSPAQKSTNLGHPFEDRPLSIEEYLAIQGFPADYELAGSLQDQYTQVGNAVPIRLAYNIGKSIYNHIKVPEPV